jgi:hypothetical protein
MEEFAFPSFLIARRQAFEKAGYFDETLSGMEHYDMVLRLAFDARFAFVSGPVGTSRLSKEHAWSSRIKRGQHQTELLCILNKAFALLPDTTATQALRRKVFSRWFTEIARWLDTPETGDLLRSHVLYSLKENPWLMRDPACRDSTLGYASKVLTHTLQSSSIPIHPAIRSFCHDVKNTQNGDYEQHAFQTRHFLGDTLTQTASQMLDRGDLKTAGYTATCAIREDVTQIIRQVRAASKRFARALLPN